MNMASGLAAIILSTWPVTEVSVRVKRSLATILIPRASATALNCSYQPSP